jgi:F-type H+-transporting ATPase subunit epsilon
VADSFRCTLVTPERQVLDEPVTYASIPAWDGQIGIMHDRAPLLARLGTGLLRLDASGGTRWFAINGGFAQMKENQLSLVANEAVAADEVNRASADSALKAAEERTAVTDEEVARKERDIARARALIELSEHGATAGAR